MTNEFELEPLVGDEDIDPITGKLSQKHIDNCSGCSLCDPDFDAPLPDDYEEYKDQEIEVLNSNK